MKIKRLSVYDVEIPFGDTAYKANQRTTVSSISGTIVSIETDEGLIGWGEMAPWGSSYLPEFTEGVRAGLKVLGPKIIGESAINPGRLNACMDAALNGHTYVKSSIDLACWDILGKATGQPVHALLGGQMVTRAPLNCAVYHGDAADMIDRIEGYREQGIRIFSTKPSGNADADIKLYEAIAEQRRDGEIYIADANRAWSVPIALRVARALERYGFYHLEQPCNSYEECLRVRNKTSLTMTLDESIVDFDSLARANRDNAADIIHIKLSRLGGLTRARQALDFCLLAGLSVSWASSGGTEISDAAATHIACATPKHALFGLWSCREFNIDRFADGGPRRSEGSATPTHSPGLGVEPIIDKLGEPVAVFE